MAGAQRDTRRMAKPWRDYGQSSPLRLFPLLLCFQHSTRATGWWCSPRDDQHATALLLNAHTHTHHCCKMQLISIFRHHCDSHLSRFSCGPMAIIRIVIAAAGRQQEVALKNSASAAVKRQWALLALWIQLNSGLVRASITIITSTGSWRLSSAVVVIDCCGAPITSYTPSFYSRSLRRLTTYPN